MSQTFRCDRCLAITDKAANLWFVPAEKRPQPMYWEEARSKTPLDLCPKCYETLLAFVSPNRPGLDPSDKP